MRSLVLAISLLVACHKNADPPQGGGGGQMPPAEVTVVVQVAGRVRGRVQLPTGASEEEATSAALASEPVRRHLPDGRPARVVFVPDRLINLVP